MARPRIDSVLTLTEALIATADQPLWQRYCRLAAELTGASAAPVEPTFAIGSMEWQRQRDQRPTSQTDPLSRQEQAAGRQRLGLRGVLPSFAGAPSPFGAVGRAEFDAFIVGREGAPLLSEIKSVEEQLVAAFEKAGRSGRYRAVGISAAATKEIDPDWFGRIRLDFANNRLVLPDDSVVAGIEVTLARVNVSGPGKRERPAQAMLREALIALWERGAFTAGTGNERVLALVLQELRLSASDPPYGFKSAETIRKLRKALKMSL